MRTDRTQIITFTGRPGSGKSIIIKNVLAACPDLQMFVGKSITTRPRRKGDVKGEYMHVQKKGFDAREARGEFLWTAEHNGYRFGTRKADVVSALGAENLSVMTLVPDAVRKLHEFAGSDQVISFFIDAPEEVIMRRMIDLRGDARATALSRAKETATWTHQTNMFIVANTKDEDPPAKTAIESVLKILKKC